MKLTFNFLALLSLLFACDHGLEDPGYYAEVHTTDKNEAKKFSILGNEYVLPAEKWTHGIKLMTIDNLAMKERVSDESNQTSLSLSGKLYINNEDEHGYTSYRLQDFFDRSYLVIRSLSHQFPPEKWWTKFSLKEAEDLTRDYYEMYRLFNGELKTAPFEKVIYAEEYGLLFLKFSMESLCIADDDQIENIRKLADNKICLDTRDIFLDPIFHFTEGKYGLWLYFSQSYSKSNFDPIPIDNSIKEEQLIFEIPPSIY